MAGIDKPAYVQNFAFMNETAYDTADLEKMFAYVINPKLRYRSEWKATVRVRYYSPSAGARNDFEGSRGMPLLVSYQRHSKKQTEIRIVRPTRMLGLPDVEAFTCLSTGNAPEDMLHQLYWRMGEIARIRSYNPNERLPEWRRQELTNDFRKTNFNLRMHDKVPSKEIMVWQAESAKRRQAYLQAVDQVHSRQIAIQQALDFIQERRKTIVLDREKLVECEAAALTTGALYSRTLRYAPIEGEGDK